MSYVVWFDEFDPDLAPRLGGKCAALGELTRPGWTSRPASPSPPTPTWPPAGR